MAIITKYNYSEINTAAAHKMDMFSKIWRVLVYISSLALGMLVYNNTMSCWVTLTSCVNSQSFILDLTLFMFNKYFEERTDEFNFPCRKTGLIMSPFINVRNSKKGKKIGFFGKNGNWFSTHFIQQQQNNLLLLTC